MVMLMLESESENFKTKSYITLVSQDRVEDELAHLEQPREQIRPISWSLRFDRAAREGLCR